MSWGHGHDNHGGGHGGWGGGSNMAWECLFWYHKEVGGAANQTVGMISFLFTWIFDNWWSSGWHDSHGKH